MIAGIEALLAARVESGQLAEDQARTLLADFRGRLAKYTYLD